MARVRFPGGVCRWMENSMDVLTKSMPGKPKGFGPADRTPDGLIGGRRKRNALGSHRNTDKQPLAVKRIR
jgi:hypothetical protein